MTLDRSPTLSGGELAKVEAAVATAAASNGRVIRDGMVAVLVSRGFGAGWSSWNSGHDALLFDPAIVAAIEAGDRDAAVARAEVIHPDGYFGGIDGLTVKWLPVGTAFQISEYDGSEGIETSDGQDWKVA